MSFAGHWKHLDEEFLITAHVVGIISSSMNNGHLDIYAFNSWRLLLTTAM
jgi:hypothetical protein